MKILQVGKYYFPEHGGIETVLQNLSEGLASRGHQVTVLCSSSSPIAKQSQNLPTLHNEVEIVRAPSYGLFFSQPLSFGLPHLLSKLASQYDIVHVHTPNPFAEMSTMVLPRKKPLVVSHHSDIIRQKIILPMYTPLLRKFLKRASQIVVATENHITSSSYLRAYKEKCAIIPYGIKTNPVHPQHKDLIHKIHGRFGRFILFVGRLVPYKGVEVLIDAMKQIDSNAVIIGDGHLRTTLESKVKDLKIQNKVHFLGRVDDVSPFYSACEAFVLPSVSNNEAFGVVQLEAMAAGKPSIISNLNSGISLVQEEGVTGFHFTPGDSVDLSKKINLILNDENKAKVMGEAARRRFERFYTQERMVESYIRLYEALF
jgi:rhamnosyl/mannosyltransferase